MKWQNRYIKVVERINIPKFSDSSQISLIILLAPPRCTVIRGKSDISFEITNEENCLFLSKLLLSGCPKFPDCEMYWEATPGAFVYARSDLIFRNASAYPPWS